MPTEKELKEISRQLIQRNSELLAKVLERTENILSVNEKQEHHLAQINGTVANIERSRAAVEATLYGRNADRGLCGEVSALRKYFLYALVVILGGGSLSVAELTNLINLIK